MFKTEKGFVVTLGKAQITDYYETEKAALEQLPNRKQLRTLITIISAVANNVYDFKKTIGEKK